MKRTRSIPAILCLPLSLFFLGVSSDSAEAQYFVREDGKAPQCGLGKTFHQGRRRAFLDVMKQEIAVFRGLPTTRNYREFHQAKNFWYLTGVDAPDVAVVLVKEGAREILFLPRANRGRESWEGELWDVEDEWVPEVSGFTDVRPMKDLIPVLEALVKKRKEELKSQEPLEICTQLTPWISIAGAQDRAGPYDRRQVRDPLDGRRSREQQFKKRLEEKLDVRVKDASPYLNKLRLVKTKEEIVAMKRAATVGAHAMMEAMRSTRPGLGEWEVESVMNLVFRREGALGPAYLPIVGSGPNSLVLHYSGSTRRMRDGEVLLIDYAPEFDRYTCDITRTWPVNGKFTQRQAAIYDAVLAAQKAGIAASKPGARLQSVERAVRRVLQDRGFGRFIRHGACHWVGMEVHDVGFYMSRLEPGMCYTIEPGLYDPETKIGVRIEDVIVITKDGCDVITKAVPKERKAVLKLMKEPGVLEFLDRRRR